MPKLVVHGAMMSCSCGTTPATLSVLPAVGSSDADHPVATVMDFVPNVNIPAFGMCTTQANPQVAAATTAAQGVLTPQPCIPVTTSPWSPGAAIATANGLKLLTSNSKASCTWTGSVSISDPGSQVDVD